MWRLCVLESVAWHECKLQLDCFVEAYNCEAVIIVFQNFASLHVIGDSSFFRMNKINYNTKFNISWFDHIRGINFLHFFFLGVAVHYFDEAHLPYWLSWCCLSLRRQWIWHCLERSGKSFLHFFPLSTKVLWYVPIHTSATIPIQQSGIKFHLSSS